MIANHDNNNNRWGYLQTGSGVPEGELGIVSRTIDLAYTGAVCKDTFGLTEPADVEAINKYGGFEISYPRLAIGKFFFSVICAFHIPPICA